MGQSIRKWQLVEAAKILRKHLNPFVQYSELGGQVHAADRSARSPEDIELDAKLNMPLASPAVGESQQLSGVRTNP